jgi:carbonic anhydrase/acetyltransferase-like protein (isoleucine patch superfamily)
LIVRAALARPAARIVRNRMNSIGNERCHMIRSGDAFIASTASVVGAVILKRDASVWYGAVLRGDDDSIELGERSNLQDNVVVHPLEHVPTIIGDDVTVGHGAILHMKSIGPRCLIGMGAILLGDAVIGEECMIAAGALVKEKAVIPPRSLVVGMPGKVIRTLTDDEVRTILGSAREYVAKARRHLLPGS